MTQFMLNRWSEISSTTDAEKGNAENFGIFDIYIDSRTFTDCKKASQIAKISFESFPLSILKRIVSLNRNIKEI